MPVGGSKVIAESVLENVIDSDGQVLVKSKVSKILVRDNKAYGV